MINPYISAKTNNQNILGWCGLLGAIVVGVGEFLVHFSSSGYDGAADFLWLVKSDMQSVIIGHYLMVLGIPLYFAGYYFIYLVFRGCREVLARWILALGVISFSMGGVWAGSRALLSEIVKNGNHDLISFYKNHYEVLVIVLRGLVFLISALWIFLVLTSGNKLKKWLAFVNPILVLGLVFLTYLIVPTIGGVLVPTAMNVTHFVVFLSLLIHEKK
ncbi:MAG: hypothetical protein AB7O48_08840 [Cyclobacteriaceae bacterium]